MNKMNINDNIISIDFENLFEYLLKISKEKENINPNIKENMSNLS